jgi:phospholipid/cholesterol/gamma-HCH transport system substrate-binding protein
MENFSSDMSDITGDNKDQIHTVLVALGDVADSLQDVLGKNGNINQATERFDRTMASLERIINKVERGEGTIGKLINDESTINKVNDTMDNINDTFGLFRKIQLNIRYRGEFLTGVDKLQNMIGLTVAPAPDKYLLFEVVDAPSGKTKVIRTTVNSGGVTISSTETIQSVDELLFSLELAKKFWDLTLRFGLIRSKGGAGADYSLFDDKFVISVEGFDFNRPNNRAHLRAYGTIYLYKHLLLTGGVDDLITKIGSRNVFFGAGIQFTDQDLKALVTLLPRSGV